MYNLYSPTPYIFGCFYTICLIIIVLFWTLLIGKCFSVIVWRLLFSKICPFFLCPISLLTAFKVVEFCLFCLKKKDKVHSKSLAYFLFLWFYYEGICFISFCYALFKTEAKSAIFSYVTYFLYSSYSSVCYPMSYILSVKKIELTPQEGYFNCRYIINMDLPAECI